MRERLMAAEKVTGIQWRDGTLHLLDQRLLPAREQWLECADVASVVQAIRAMAVRGAAAIGIAAAYGLVLALRERLGEDDWEQALEEDFLELAEARPTAANLFWALNRMRERLQRLSPEDDLLGLMEAEAVAIHESDREANLTMAQHGIEQIRRHQGSEQTLLTYGNAGALASGGFGTALGVIHAAYLEGMVERVYAGETRPWLQGSRLTAWELGGHPGHRMCRLGAGTSDEDQRHHLGRGRRRLHRRQWRCGEQDRYLSDGGRGHASRCALHGRGIEHQHRPEFAQWRRHSSGRARAGRTA